MSQDWPDWSGEAVAIIASGPSAKKAGIELLKGRVRVLAIKKNVELAPWADAVYGCDFPWWRSVDGLRDFKGLRMAYDPKACDQYGAKKVDISLKDDKILMDRVGLVGAGGNSGFQSVNLAAQFGANRILLVGFDMHGRSGEHWYGRNGWPNGNNPSEDNYRRWRAAFNSAAPTLEGLGIEVVNVSPNSELKSFRKAGIADTLKAWELS